MRIKERERFLCEKTSEVLLNTDMYPFIFREQRARPVSRERLVRVGQRYVDLFYSNNNNINNNNNDNNDKI